MAKLAGMNAPDGSQYVSFTDGNGNALGAGSKYLSSVNTATTYALKTGSGVLFNIIVGSATVASPISVYDNTTASGPTVCSITTALAGGFYNYGITYTTGLTVLTGGTSASYTVTYV